MASFIGRGPELQALDAALARARAGSGSIALVHGDLGIGKTRLVSEFSVRAEGCRYKLAGRWYESSEVPGDTGFREAFLPLAQSLRPRIHSTDPAFRQLASLGPEFAELATTGPEPPPETGPEDRYLLLRGVVKLIELATRDGAVLLTLDDLQWCDEASLETLAFLARDVARLPLMLVITYRDDDIAAAQPHNKVLLDLARTDGFQRLLLRGLSRHDVAFFMSELRNEPASPACVDDLFDHTRGNPLFVQELTVQFIDGAAESSDAPLPDSLRTVIGQRYARLSLGARRLVSIAAVIGHDCDLQLLQQVAGVPRDDLVRHTGEALAAGVLRSSEHGVLSFVHPIMRSAVYQDIAPPDVVDLHLRVARALTSRDRQLHAKEIARHMIAAGSLAPRAETIACCLAAARQARKGFAFQEAERFLQAGLRVLHEPSSGEETLHAALLTELGYAQSALGQPDAALSVYREALAIYEDLSDVAGALDIRRWLAATLMHYGRWQDALDVTSPGLAAIEEQATDAYLGLIGNHALALLLTGRIAEMEPWVEKELRLAFSRRTKAGAHHSAAGWHSWGFGNPEEAGDQFVQARTLFYDEGLHGTAAQVALDHAFASYFLGDFETATAMIDDAERLAIFAARDFVLADVHAFHALWYTHRGDWVRAASARAAWRSLLGRIGGGSNYSHFARSSLALELWTRRGPDAAAEALDDRAFPLVPGLLARLQVDKDPAAECPTLDTLQKLIPKDGKGIFWLTLVLPVTAALNFVAPQAAREYHDALFRHRGCVTDWNVVEIELARTAAANSCWDEAEHHFEQAQAFCEARGLRPLLSSALFGRGVALLRSGAQRRRATVYLEEAREIAEDLGMDYALRRLQPVHPAPRGRPPAAGPGGLTPREATVLSLLAKGMSNREIAQALVVAERTVGHHLERVYAKLMVSNRAAAIARARQLGLISEN